MSADMITVMDATGRIKVPIAILDDNRPHYDKCTQFLADGTNVYPVRFENGPAKHFILWGGRIREILDIHKTDKGTQYELAQQRST